MYRTAYFAFFHTHSIYSVVFRGNSSHRLKILHQQQVVVKILANVPIGLPCQQIFTNLRKLHVLSILICETLIQIHRILSKYILRQKVHEYNTRNALRIRTIQVINHCQVISKVFK